MPRKVEAHKLIHLEKPFIFIFRRNINLSKLFKMTYVFNEY